jgi:hypothetical protein
MQLHGLPLFYVAVSNQALSVAMIDSAGPAGFASAAGLSLDGELVSRGDAGLGVGLRFALASGV